MSETGAEIPIQTEAKPALGKRDFEVAGNNVEVKFVRFSGEENPGNDPKKAAFLLTDWPMRADAQITWGQPAMLAKEFRQFATELEQGGVQELTLFGHSIGASKVVDLAVALEQKNPNLKVNTVLINPAGLSAQTIFKIAKNYLREGSVEKRIRNPNRIFQPHLQVLVDLCASIFKDMKATKLRYPQLFLDQMRALAQLNANLARLKSPVLIMVATDDPVFPAEGLLPSQKMNQINPPTKASEDSRERMARVGKAREQYLKEKLLPQASDVRVIVATKYANHIAFGVERPRPSSHIIAKYFDRLRR